MKRRLYPHLVRDISRHGQIRWYFRRGNEPKVRLPDYPGASKEAEAAYFAALDGKPVEREPGGARFPEKSFGALVSRYMNSPKFQALAPITQSGYRRQLDALRLEVGAEPYTAFRRRHIVALIERKGDKPGEANNVLKALQALFTYGVKSDLLETSPAAGVEKLKVTTERAGGSETWTEEHAAMFRARWPLGSPQRTLFEIMWGSGLRIGDALLLGPQHVRSGRLQMITGKKDEPVDLPIVPELAEALAAAPTPHLTYLATQGGTTRSAKAAYSWFSGAAKAAGIPARYTAHGCRKGLLTARAEAGATEHQLAAIAGHGSTRSVAPYVKKARKARLADAGFGVSGETAENRKATSTVPPSKKVGL
jgi:integrase/recombinase XerD